MIRDEVETALRHLDLASFFPHSCLFCSDPIGYRKPSRKLYGYTLKQMNVKAKQAVMIGDSWKQDIDGAARVHIDSVWFKPDASYRWKRRRLGNARTVILRSFKDVPRLFL